MNSKGNNKNAAEHKQVPACQMCAICCKHPVSMHISRRTKTLAEALLAEMLRTAAGLTAMGAETYAASSSKAVLTRPLIVAFGATRSATVASARTAMAGSDSAETMTGGEAAARCLLGNACIKKH